MTYHKGATEGERLTNAYADGFSDGEKVGFARGECHGLGLATENAYRQGAEEMRERVADWMDDQLTIPERRRLSNAIRALPIGALTLRRHYRRGSR